MRKIHIIGICGIGMSAIAQYCQINEYEVQGSDTQINNAMSDYLISKDIKVLQNDSNNITQEIDFIVKSTAIRDSDSEIIRATELNIPILSRSEMLTKITRESEYVISVSGVHGKTTTTTMAAEMFVALSENPTVFSGGLMGFCKNNFHSGNRNLMVIEADESDGTFMHLKTDLAVLTNVEFEHAEYYRDLQHMMTCCETFINSAKIAVMCGDDVNIRQLKIHVPTLFYGFKNTNDVYAINVQRNEFEVIVSGTNIGKFKLNAYGKHNLLNALCVLSIAVLKHGLNERIVDIWRQMISHFHGVHRRFNIVRNEQITVIDDYAHHPTEIAATIEAANGLGSRIVAVIQPHRYTRLNALMNEFMTCIGAADVVIISDVYSAGENPIHGVSGKELVNRIASNNCYFASGQQEIYDLLKQIALPGDVILFMGAGTITNWAREYNI